MLTAADLSARVLTAEDVPPRALGGKPIILTCNSCNHEAGHSIDAEAAKRARQNYAAAIFMGNTPGYAGRAVLQAGDAAITVDVRIDEDNTRVLEIISESNNPAEITKITSYFESLGSRADGTSLRITMHDKFHRRRAQVSDLRAAFLAFTAAIGYRFALNNRLTAVRDQIMRPDEPILPDWWVDKRWDVNGLMVSDELGVAIAAMHHGTVVLPWPSGSSSVYSVVVADILTNKLTQLACARVPWPTSFAARADHLNALLGQPKASLP